MRARAPATTFAESRRPIALLFPGQGAQHARMGAGMYGHDAVFTDTMDTAFALMGGWGVRLRAEWLADRPSPLFDDVTRAQPLLYAVDCALGHVVMSWGVKPIALLGHSVGEMAAATLAGIFTLADGVRLMRDRVDQITGSPPGGMLAVAAAADDLLPYLSGQVVVGAVNGRRQTLLAGPAEALREVRARLLSAGFTSRPTRARQAFHSPIMASAAARSLPAWQATTLAAPHTPLYSAYRGAPLTPQIACDPHFWTGQPAAAVYFGPALDRLLDDGDFLLVEAGPGQGLTALARRHPALLSGRSDATAMLPARPGDPARDRAAVRRAANRIRAEGHGLSKEPIIDTEGETCRTQPLHTA